MNLTKTQTHFPFLLKPVGKDYLWGGERLNTEFGKGIDLKPLAETWECSTHNDGVSIIASGEFSGMKLSEYIARYPNSLGERYKQAKQFPILVKFIDAKQNLSVQVHPSDEYAREHENGQLGKSEMWYIVDADKNAKIVYGFNRDMKKNEVKSKLNDDTIENCLQYINVQKNEVYFIDAGTVHAIGAGCLIAEIQENSNLTYRLYDYNRTDKNGKKRELHIDKALDVINLKSSANPRQPMRMLKYKPGCATELLCRCKYFEVNRLFVNTEVLRNPLAYNVDELSFRVLMCIDGCGSIRSEGNDDKVTVDFYKGDAVFVPANAKSLIHGKARFLEAVA